MKQSHKFLFTASVLSVLSLTTSPLFADPSTQPSAQPTVASVLSDMDTAYAKIKSATFDGHVVGHFDVAGQSKDQDVAFTSSFSAPNQFRHEVPSEILLGSNGKNVYSFLNGRDQYQMADAPKERSASKDWPASVMQILESQNPSLLLAVSKSASAELNDMTKNITLVAPTDIDGTSFDTLKFDIGDSHQIVTMLVDQSTHLLREVKVDLKQSLEKAGTTDVKAAEVTIDYTKSVPDATVGTDQFAWTAPMGGAMLTTATNTLAAADGDLSDDLKGLIGKDAPDFSLKGFDDKAVKLSDSKGSVVIVDFWATWCGPCVQSLPHLNKLYKDKSGDGLKVFAVNLQEGKDKVQPFVEKKGWTFPVLLDSDGAVAGTYKADAIPETVVIGKDGKVKQIFVGGGHEEEVAALVEAEMKK